LVLHLDFEENVLDLSGVGNDGMLINGAEYATDVPDVLGGGHSLSFANGDGIENQGVDIPGDASLGANPFTLAYWIKPTTGQGNAGLERLTSRASDTLETAVGNANAVGGTTSPSGITLSYYQGGWHVTNVEIIQDEWVHVAWVSTAGGMELFLNGESAYTGPAVPAGRPGTGFMRVGTRHNNVEGYEGLMDDLRLYAATLSAEQVMGLARGGGGGIQFGITEIVPAGDGSEVSITWNSRPGRLYSLDFSADLNLWNEIDDGIASGGESTTYADSLAAPSNPERGYYRVREN
jgi:hypothetical protein